MHKKTAGMVEGDVFALIRDSELMREVAGGLYKQGTRPFGSREEDVEVVFLTGSGGQIQEGIVNINIYVPNIDNGMGAGLLTKDVRRCVELEGALCRFMEGVSLFGEYHTEIDEMVRTLQGENECYLVNGRLRFRVMGS